MYSRFMEYASTQRRFIADASNSMPCTGTSFAIRAAALMASAFLFALMPAFPVLFLPVLCLPGVPARAKADAFASA